MLSCIVRENDTAKESKMVTILVAPTQPAAILMGQAVDNVADINTHVIPWPHQG